jgi:hypothetical protein
MLYPENYLAAVKSGVHRALGSIASSTVDKPSCLKLCASGLLILSSFQEGIEELACRGNILQALFK